MRTQVSVDNTTDQDYYSVEAPVDAQASITLTPRGSIISTGHKVLTVVAVQVAVSML
ncbi:MAG: hypothetical protein ACJATO_002981 [Arenicella sp.]|jgi:hypothetical protein